jgi:parvulin-like peptidyl-prolyl isomerase
LLAIKNSIEDEVQKKVAQLPASSDNLVKEKARTKALEEAFSEAARKFSNCPSKEQGGDLGWFPRAGSMVEPFARAAFALKPHELSDVVITQFGQHLILATDRRAGKETKFEEVKDVVKEVYRDKLRESLCVQLRPRAKIVVSTAGK